MTYRMNVEQMTPEESKNRREKLAGLRKAFLNSRAIRRVRKPYVRNTPTPPALSADDKAISLSLYERERQLLSERAAATAMPSMNSLFMPLGATSGFLQSHLQSQIARSRQALLADGAGFRSGFSAPTESGLDSTRSSSLMDRAAVLSRASAVSAGGALGGMSIADAMFMDPSRNSSMLNQLLQHRQQLAGGVSAAAATSAANSSAIARLLSIQGTNAGLSSPEDMDLAAAIQREQYFKSLLLNSRMMARQQQHDAAAAATLAESRTAASMTPPPAADTGATPWQYDMPAAADFRLQAIQKRGLEDSNDEAFREWKRARGLH